MSKMSEIILNIRYQEINNRSVFPKWTEDVCVGAASRKYLKLEEDTQSKEAKDNK